MYVLAYFLAKKGEKNGIFILSICLLSILSICLCMSAFILHLCLVFLLLHLFYNYFRLCVDLVMNVATS